jgi:CheY-like chemotaxis protein
MACARDGLSDRPAWLKDERILVVEDEALVSILVEDELRGAGAEVLGPAPTVVDALRLVEAAAADGGISAAVLDINLAGRHVGPLADRLAALGVPFVFATGYGEGCDTGGHGAAPTLDKPFGAETLVAAVASLASARGRRRAAHGAGCSRRNRGPDGRR